MTRVLLTGGSGFIATHILDILLKNGHSVVFTVRSTDKAHKLINAHPEAKPGRLSYALVEDIGVDGAFDNAVKSDPPFEVILHTASLVTLHSTDTNVVFETAIKGTLGIMKAAAAHCPSLKRMVITSSIAAVLNLGKGNAAGYCYSAEDWNPITKEQALETSLRAYVGGKTWAEKSAWEFVENEKPGFDLAVILPPLVFGPNKPYIHTCEGINDSNKRILKMVRGELKDGLSPAILWAWADVRDIAEAHVRAFEVPEAGGKRWFVTEGTYCNQQIADIIKKNFPELKDRLPEGPDEDDPFPDVYTVDGSPPEKVLGIRYIELEKCIVDTVESLREMGAF